VLLARNLGKISFGQFSFAISFTNLFLVFTDLGLSPITTRNIARNREKAGKYLGNILIIKALFCLFTFFSIATLINVMNYSSDVKMIVYMLGGYIIFQSYGLFFNAISNAFERMEIEALLTSLLRFFILAGVSLVLSLKLGVIDVAKVHVLSGLIYALIGFLMITKLFAKPQCQVDRKLWMKLIKEGFPFAVSSIFLIISTQIDVVMLSMMKSDAAVGSYSAALRLVSALLFIPANFAKSLYPIFSRLWPSSIESFVQYYNKSFQILMMIAIPVAIGGMLLSNKIIILVYGNEYFASVIIFRILVWSLAIQFVSTLLGIIMAAINRQTTSTKICFWGMLLNIAMNLFLIPRFSGAGAAVSTLLTNCFYFATFFLIISKEIFSINLINVSARPLISGLFLGIFVFLLKDLNIVIVVCIGAVIYSLLLICVKALKVDDWRLLKEIFLGLKYSGN
jgi:O-antigen/teichoic acid export membrane protein